MEQNNEKYDIIDAEFKRDGEVIYSKHMPNEEPNNKENFYKNSFKYFSTYAVKQKQSRYFWLKIFIAFIIFFPLIVLIITGSLVFTFIFLTLRKLGKLLA